MNRTEYIIFIGTLGFLLLSAIGLYSMLDGNRAGQLVIAVISAIGYILWGLFFHSAKKDLHPKVVIEYVLISVIALVLIVNSLGF